MAEKEKIRKRYPELSPFGEATKLEEEILAYWEANDIFKRSIDERPAASPFVFYEGPPTANGRPLRAAIECMHAAELAAHERREADVV